MNLQTCITNKTLSYQLNENCLQLAYIFIIFLHATLCFMQVRKLSQQSVGDADCGIFESINMATKHKCHFS